ncbi:uncharacterized protein [Nicotiana sylvestris]|uniref:uncharacterized protein n=1 Tax=Nicotiana sylvestris TaxID=4096 RepID=UPI00388C3BA3
MVIENHKFSNIIKLRERIEEGIKSGMVKNFEALQATNKALQSGGKSKMKEVGAVMVAQGPKSPLTCQTPPPTYQTSASRYSQPTTNYHTYKTQAAYYHPPPTRPNYQKPRPNFDYEPPKQYITIAEPIDQLYKSLKVVGYVTPIPVVAMDNSSQWVNPNKPFAYHSGMKGHTIDECRTLKYKIQTLIDNKVIQAKEVALNVQSPVEVEVTASIPFEVEVTPPIATPVPFEVEVATPFIVTVATTPLFKSNSIPSDYITEASRTGKTKMEESSVAQGMTRTGRIYTPENLGGSSKEAATKQPVIETGPDDLSRKVQAREYSVINHLNKTPAQIFILSLLQNSEAHRSALIKILNEAYVPNNITNGEMTNMVGQVLESHKITFHEDELPLEGLSHNRALHITVQFEDKFFARVLIDEGSSLKICPLITLKRLGKDFHEIRAGSMNVKVFDGSQRATIGEINLCLQM